MSKSIERGQITDNMLEDVFVEIIVKTKFRIAQKGSGAFASNHEIYGIIIQEAHEYEKAIHERASDDEKIEELKDIAVAAILGIASIKSGGIDW